MLFITLLGAYNVESDMYYVYAVMESDDWIVEIFPIIVIVWFVITPTNTDKDKIVITWIFVAFICEERLARITG